LAHKPASENHPFIRSYEEEPEDLEDLDDLDELKMHVRGITGKLPTEFN